MQGYCRRTPAIDVALQPRRRHQCVLLVDTSFVAFSGVAVTWLNNIYVKGVREQLSRGVVRAADCLLDSSQLYLTDVFVEGDGGDAQGMRVDRGCRSYVAGASAPTRAPATGARSRDCRTRLCTGSALCAQTPSLLPPRLDVRHCPCLADCQFHSLSRTGVASAIQVGGTPGTSNVTSVLIDRTRFVGNRNDKDVVTGAHGGTVHAGRASRVAMQNCTMESNIGVRLGTSGENAVIVADPAMRVEAQGVGEQAAASEPATVASMRRELRVLGSPMLDESSAGFQSVLRVRRVYISPSLQIAECANATTYSAHAAAADCALETFFPLACRAFARR